MNAGVLDTTPPTASISAGNITSPGGTTETVTVTYTDSGSGMNSNTIKTSNLSVSGPGRYSDRQQRACEQRQRWKCRRHLFRELARRATPGVRANNGNYTINVDRGQREG